MPSPHETHMAKAEDYLIITITEFIKQHLDHNCCCIFSLTISCVEMEKSHYSESCMYIRNNHPCENVRGLQKAAVALLK